MNTMILKYTECAIEWGVINSKGLNSQSVKINNKNAQNLRLLAIEISKSDSNVQTEFFNLLNHNDSNVRIWCAHHILEMFSSNRAACSESLKIIEDKSVVDVGERMWLKKWKKENGLS